MSHAVLAFPQSSASDDIGPGATESLKNLHRLGWLRWKPHPRDMSGCIGPLLEGLGWEGDVRQLCDALPQHKATFEAVDFFNVMACLGYRYHAMDKELQQVGEEQLPALFMPLDNMHATLVLLEKTDKGILSFDSEHRSHKLITCDARKGALYHFTRIPHEEDAAEAHARIKAGTSWFRMVLERFSKVFWYTILLSLLINLMTLSVPIFIMTVYDKVIGARSLMTLPYLLAGIAIAIMVEGMLRYTRVRLMSWFGARINILVSSALFERLLFLPPSHTERASVAAQLARVKAFEAVRDFFTGTMFLTLLELPFVIVIMLAIALIAGPLVWIPVLVTLAYASLLIITRWTVKISIHRAARAGSERHQLAMETFSSLETLKYNGLTSTWLSRYNALSAKSAKAGFQSGFSSSVIEHIAHALTMIAGVATIAFGVEQIWAGAMTAGGLVATMILTWRVLNPLQTACAMLPRLENVRSSIEQVNQLMTMKPERDPVKAELVYKTFRGDVAFNGVGLRYSRKTDPVFTGLSFNLRPGQMLAITGGNGSGKSSILKLVNGLYAPQAGSIRIDGADIRQMDPVVLRRQIRYLPQSPDFFSGSIQENIRLCVPLASDAQIKEALQRADAWEDIQSLTAGVDTQIGSGQTILPSGLAFRLGLARIYLQDASIILCDELPFAILNSNTGEQFRRFLKEVHGSHTVIMVSHREDYLRMADYVVTLRPDRRPQLSKPQELQKVRQL